MIVFVERSWLLMILHSRIPRCVGRGVVCFMFWPTTVFVPTGRGCVPFCWIDYCKYLHYVAIFRERAVREAQFGVFLESLPTAGGGQSL
jgi:hypothetical protein